MEYRVIAECIIDGRRCPGDIVDLPADRAERAIKAGVIRPLDVPNEELTVRELREACKSRGLSAAGNKADLIERLGGD